MLNNICTKQNILELKKKSLIAAFRYSNFFKVRSREMLTTGLQKVFPLNYKIAFYQQNVYFIV